MLILLTDGEYSDYHIDELLEWNGTLDEWNAIVRARREDYKARGKRDWRCGLRDHMVEHGALVVPWAEIHESKDWEIEP